MENKKAAYQVLLLTLVSFISLYFEVALIRWIPGQVRVVNYFTNLVLIANFLGLGLGCATPQRTENNEWRFPFRLALLMALALAVKSLGFLPAGEQWGESYFRFTHLGLVPVFVWAMIIFFGTVLVQIPLGRILGRALQDFPPLAGYSLNLLGSVLGVSAMALFNTVRVGPVWWFALGMVLYLPFFPAIPRWRLKALALGSALAVLLLVWFATGSESWSPYYKIKMEKSFTLKYPGSAFAVPLGDAGFSLTINDNFFQITLDLSPQYLERLAPDNSLRKTVLEPARDFYQLPYQVGRPQSVLILGAGTGNDVAQALRSGVPQIDAVEIDPVIAELGILHHPEHPFQSPRVSLFIDDARHYLKSTAAQYDMIIYGLLDSQRLVSYISTVRQDNFVYTREGLQEAARRLKTGGTLVVAHVSRTGSPQSIRLFQMLEQLFPGRVHALESKEAVLSEVPWNIFLAGPESLSGSIKDLSNMKDITNLYRSYPSSRLPTDNWPFLYLSTQSFWRTDYFKTLLALILISFLVVFRTVPEMKKISPHFFLLGAGFLLLETKSIIEMSIFFGSTWVVNSVVIGAFLVMALLANMAVQLFKLQRTYLFYLLLLAALALNLAFPVSRLASASLPLRILAGGGLAALPVLFSGIVFAISFKKVDSPGPALGANIMGAVLGGFCEYSSLFTGYRFLYIIAAVFYLGSWAFARRK